MMKTLMNILGVIVLPIMLVVSHLTNNETLLMITLIMLVALLLGGVIVIGQMILGSAAESVSSITQWRYVPDPEYGGFAIQAKRELFGKTWWTSEYLSGSQEEAERLVKMKQNR